MTTTTATVAATKIGGLVKGHSMKIPTTRSIMPTVPYRNSMSAVAAQQEEVRNSGVVVVVGKEGNKVLITISHGDRGKCFFSPQHI